VQHIFICENPTCRKEWKAYCHEFFATEEGHEQRGQQIESGLCPECFAKAEKVPACATVNEGSQSCAVPSVKDVNLVHRFLHRFPRCF